MCVPIRVKVHFRPTTPPVPFELFCREYPTRSIAADGFVSGGLTQYRFDEGGSWLAIDHHGPQAGLLLRVSCEQMLDVVLNPSFFGQFINPKGEFAPEFFAAHPDEDVCTCIWLLKNADRVREERLPRLETLLWMEGRMDATAGTYRFPPGYDEKLRRLNYVFEPYRVFKNDGGLARKNPAEYLVMAGKVCHRITQFVDGGTHELPFDTEYEVLHKAPFWVMIREIGLHARRGIFRSDRIHGFISVSELAPGPDRRPRWRYIMGARDSWGPFKTAKFGQYLNQLEGCTTDKWGGNDVVWGSPQATGSAISPDELQKLALTFHGL